MMDIFHVAQAVEEAVHAIAETVATEPTSPAALFGLNWKLFVAQVVNFSIVVLVLWKWVFGPLGKRLSDRQDRIEKALGDAKNIEGEKAEMAQWKTSELSKTKQEAVAIITHAKKEADELRTFIVEQTKQEQLQLIEKAKKTLENEVAASVQRAKGELAELVVDATEKILMEKLDPQKDKKLIEKSLSQIKL